MINTDPALQLGWAVDFLDSPADGLEFRYWSGSGDLTLAGVTYQGTNGVINVNPPTEKSGEAVRMTIEMDASDPAVRQQLRHDIGPLRVRARWLYHNSIEVPGGTVTAKPSGVNNDSFPLIGTYLFPDDSPFAAIPVGGMITMQFTALGHVFIGAQPSLNTDYFARRYEGNRLVVFRTEGLALGAPSAWTLDENNTSEVALYATNSGDAAFIFFAYSTLTEFSITRAASTVTEWRLTGKEFIGRLSSPVLDGAVYTLDVESQISDIDRGRVINWSNDMQQGRHADDKGMEYLKDYAAGINSKWPP